MDCKTLDGLTVDDGQAFVNQLSPYFSIKPPEFNVIDTAELNAYAYAYKHRNIVEISKNVFINLNREELVGILCHELAHFHFEHVKKGKRLHWILGLASFLLNLVPVFYYSSLLLTMSSLFSFGILAFAFTLAQLSWIYILSIGVNEISCFQSRKFEFQADKKAAEISGPLSVIKGLFKIYLLRLGVEIDQYKDVDYVNFAVSFHKKTENDGVRYKFNLNHPPIHKRMYRIVCNCYEIKD